MRLSIHYQARRGSDNLTYYTKPASLRVHRVQDCSSADSSLIEHDVTVNDERFNHCCAATITITTHTRAASVDPTRRPGTRSLSHRDRDGAVTQATRVTSAWRSRVHVPLLLVVRPRAGRSRPGGSWTGNPDK